MRLKDKRAVSQLLAPAGAIILLVLLYKPFTKDMREARYFETMRRASMHPYADRDWHHRFAVRQGLFWLPCPKCGVEFGGHESLGKSIPHTDSALAERGQRLIICPPCSLELRPPKSDPAMNKHRLPRK